MSLSLVQSALAFNAPSPLVLNSRANVVMQEAPPTFQGARAFDPDRRPTQNRERHAKAQHSSHHVCTLSLPSLAEAAAVEKAAIAANKAGEFCYGLPGAVAPFEKFDPLFFLEGKSFEQARRM